VRHRRRERGWLLAALGLTTALAALDAAAGHGATVIGLLFAGPIVAAFGASIRGTLVVCAYALAVAIPLGAVDGIFLESEHVSRIATVALSVPIAIAIAVARERERSARRRYATLAAIGDIVQSTRDDEVMLVQVARLVARELADWCFVFVKDGERVRQVASAHADPERQRLAWELLRRYPLDPRRPEGPAAVMRDGRPRLYPEVTERLMASISADETNLKLLERMGMVSALAVPLTARGRTLGALTLATAESGIVLGQEDMELAHLLAGRVALALDSARLYTGLSRTERSLRRSRDELQAILDGVADAVTVQGPGPALVFANQAAADSFGFDSVEQLLSTPLSDIAERFEMLTPDGDPFPVDDLPARRALGGDPAPAPALVRFRMRGGGPERWSRVKATPILDESGEPVMAINVVEDVTEERALAEAQSFLAESSRILSASLDYETTLSNVAQLAVPRVADWCAVEMIEEDGSVSPVVVAHTDPAKVQWANELRERYPPDPTEDGGVFDVLRTGQSQLYPEIPEELLVQGAQDAEHLELIREVGIRSAIVVPLIARGRTLGAITLVTTDESGHVYDEDDLRLAEELAGRCALAVDNSRLYRERAHIARTLQESLLPPELPQPPGLEVAARFRAAGEGYEVGGDFYDVFDTGAAHWAAVIGDVCGKGPEAAALTALARYTLRATAMTEHVPSRILARLNEAMLRQRSDRRFSTVLYASLDQRNGATHVRFASGGHPLPLVLRAGGAATEVGEPGTLLGIVHDPDLADEDIELGPGDAVVLYTDGVTDAAAPDTVREPHELAALVHGADDRSADELAERILQAAMSTRNGTEPRDDIAILVIKVPL
jgi:PAS domain S-box-containing protein